MKAFSIDGAIQDYDALFIVNVSDMLEHGEFRPSLHNGVFSQCCFKDRGVVW